MNSAERGELVSPSDLATTRGNYDVPRFFNTGKAIKALVDGVSYQEVFPNLRTTVRRQDLLNRYIHSHDDDGKKEVVATLRTATAIDAAASLSRLPVTPFTASQGVLPITQDTPITPDDLSYHDDFPHQVTFMGSVIATSINEAATALKQVCGRKKDAHLTTAVLKAVSPALSFDLRMRRRYTRRDISKSVENNLDTIRDLLPKHFKTVVDQFNADFGYYPNFDTFWNLTQHSMGFLLRGTVRDIDYSDILRDQVLGRQDYKFSRGNTAIRTTRDGSSSLALSKNGRQTIEAKHQESFGKITPITGCPAGVRVKLEDDTHIDLISAIVNRVGATIYATIDTVGNQR